MPPLTKRLYARVAIKVYEQMEPSIPQPLHVDCITAVWQRVHRNLNLLQRARQHNWSHAALHCQRRLGWELQALKQNFEPFLGSPQCRTPAMSARDVYQDLVALQKEFSELTIDLEKHELSITTEPIVLEEIDLGSFEIILSWEQLAGDKSPYRIEALESNPAASSDEITHPHVQDQSLCEGEARPLLELALKNGQLFEFFLIVAQTLRTYNPDSAFVSLGQWYGLPCHDCGATVNEDEQVCCERCEVMICTDCYTCCTSCLNACCASCCAPCADCGDLLCDSCQIIGDCCQKLYCERCFEHEKQPVKI